jgi:hypothetical protein
MANTIRGLLSDLTPVIYNPNMVQSRILDTLRNTVNGDDYELTDSNNPFVFLLEAGIMTSLAAIENHEQCLRKSYVAMATEYNEIYSHMADRDYLDRFDEPSYTNITLLIGKDELKEKAIPLSSKEIRKIILPRDSEFSVAGYNFTMQYPVEVRVMPHGGLQVVYDTTTANPVRTLSTNTLDWEIVTIPYDGKPLDFVKITLPVMQYRITNHTENIVSGVRFVRDYGFEDKFYYARVWMRQQSNWVELPTTHSEQVINPLKATARLTVTDSNLRVYIPDVYIRNGLASGDIRVDIYTTKGKLNLDLRSYQYGEFSMNWIDIGRETDSSYTAPLSTLTYLAVYSHDVINSGRNGLTFTQLRDRVIDNAIGNQVIPVSDAQLSSTLSDKGFTITKSLDYVTDRIYHASIEMPASTIDEVSTPIGTMNGIMETSFTELSKLSTVRANGNRLTLLPETLYVIKDGLVQVDDYGSKAAYELLSVSDRVTAVNERSLLFTPFYYVLDTNSDVFEARAYYLSNPTIESKQFITTNTTLAVDVGTGKYSIAQTETGYRLLIVTRSDATYKSFTDDQVFCQVSFTPRGYSDVYAYLNGTLVGLSETERVWQFDIDTNIDIDRNHDMIVSNFIMTGDTPTDIPMQLGTELNVIFGVTNYTTADFKQTAMDQIVVSDDQGAKAITQERLRLNLGTHLSKLWTNARSIAGGVEYLRFDEDVYAKYEKDVYELDPVTNLPKISIVNSKVVFNVLHAAGDYVTDAQGNRTIKYLKGDVVIDTNGDPVPKNPRSVRRRLELFLFDGRYTIANTPTTQAYLATTIAAMLQYINEDLPSIDDVLLEKTSMYLYPKVTLGSIKVLLGDGTIAYMDAENRFKATYYLSTAARRDSQLLSAIDRTTRSCIINGLQGNTVSISNILADIRSNLSNEIIDVEMSGMGVDNDQYVFTVRDEKAKATLGKKLVVNADWSIGIHDDVAIGYVKHE